MGMLKEYIYSIAIRRTIWCVNCWKVKEDLKLFKEETGTDDFGWSWEESGKKCWSFWD